MTSREEILGNSDVCKYYWNGF